MAGAHRRGHIQGLGPQEGIRAHLAGQRDDPRARGQPAASAFDGGKLDQDERAGIALGDSGRVVDARRDHPHQRKQIAKHPGERVTRRCVVVEHRDRRHGCECTRRGGVVGPW